MLKENLKDAGQILQTILKQPLSIAGLPENSTLLSAAQNYKPNEAEKSDLSKILLSLLDFPEPTQILIRELELLEKELAV